MLLVVVCILTALSACRSAQGDGTDASAETAGERESEAQGESPTADTGEHIHLFGDQTVVKEAGCNESGQSERVCACGEKETEVLPPLPGGHTVVNNVCTKCGKEASKGLKFEKSADGASYTVTGPGACTDADLLVPDVYNELPVTAVGVGAFGNSGIRYAAVPHSVKTLGDRAFSRCTELRNVELCEGLETIGSEAFGFTSLTEIIIPDSVTELGGTAFEGCMKLKSAVIGDGVTGIGMYTFYACLHLTHVTLGKNVANVNGSAFYECSNLVEICNRSALDLTAGSDEYGRIACNAEHIYSEGDSFLHKTDGGFVFYDDGDEPNLIYYEGEERELTLPGDYNGGNYSLYRYAFGYTDLTGVTIPDGVTAIGEFTFFGCSDLTHAIIGDGVTTIGENAFSGCENLMHLTLGKNVTEIDENELGAFSGAERLVEICNRSSLDLEPGRSEHGRVAVRAKRVYREGDSCLCQTDDGYVFLDLGDSALLVAYLGDETTLVLPDFFNGKAYAVNDFAFNNLLYLAAVTVPDSVTAIGREAFSYCERLKSAVLPKDLTKISPGLFYNCSHLESVNIPETVTKIGRRTFSYCSALTTVTIPAGVSEIDTYAFENCTGLKTVNYRGSAEDWSKIEIRNFNDPIKKAKKNYEYTGL